MVIVILERMAIWARAVESFPVVFMKKAAVRDQRMEAVSLASSVFSLGSRSKTLRLQAAQMSGSGSQKSQLSLLT